MITAADVGRRVVICAADEFYAYVDGWVGTLAGFRSGFAVVHVPSEEVDTGVKEFLVPPEQLSLALTS